MNWLRWLFESETQPTTEYIKKRFVPQTDITAYEIAYLVSRMTPSLMLSPSKQVNFAQRQWVELDPQYKRHFLDPEGVN